MRFAVGLVLSGLVAAVALAAPACSNSGDAPSVSANEPAGKVVTVSGAVTATRGGSTRALGAGDSIFADDTVATGPEGAVTIELFHNGATWSLGASKQRAVATSAAWKAPRGATAVASGESDDPSMAAGRHAERESADTRATVEGTSDEAAMAEPSAPRPAITRGGEAPAPPPAAAAPSPPPPTPTPPPSPAADKPMPESMAPGATASREATVAATASDTSGGGDDESMSAKAKAKGGGGAPTPPPPPIRAPGSGFVKLASLTLAKSAGLTEDVMRDAITDRLDRMHTCYAEVLSADAAAAGTIKARLIVADDGSVSAVTVVTPVKPGALGVCATKGLRTGTYPTTTTGRKTSVVLEVTFTKGAP